ncbi:MAG TPA: radical SAM protein [Acidimicrobiales bacterium]|nr:radical SAM protein [Mycobacterium sp.]HXQ18053.1 radical SAM protein [Acidimicrobiales bacterium]
MSCPVDLPALRWKRTEEEQPALFPDETAVERHLGTGEYRGMEFLHVNARSIINSVPSASRMPFRYTINAYRGCSHACVYCFARPTHEYLGMNVGRDFERRIVVKVNAVERLRAELRAPTWSGDHIAMGTNTDPYQSAEGKYHLTRRIVEELGKAGNPFSILTKSTLVLRDLPILAAAAQRTSVRLDLSIGTLDETVWKLTEPATPPPLRRVDAVRRLNEAGIPCGVLIAPILPGLSDRDDQITAVVEACVEAGAVSVSAVPLHLRPGVREHYLAWLQEVRPDLSSMYERLFQKGSYQAATEQARVSRLVAEAGQRTPASRQDRWLGTELAAAPDPPAARTDGWRPSGWRSTRDPSEQLRLL